MANIKSLVALFALALNWSPLSSPSAIGQETDEYVQPGWLFDPANVQADFDAPLEQLPEGNCRSSNSAEPDRTYQLASQDWATRWRFAEDSDIETSEGLDAIEGYRFLLGTIVDYDQDGVIDYARVVMTEDRDSAVLIRFSDKDRQPVLLNHNLGLLNGESIKGTKDGCLIVGFPEVGAVTHFMRAGRPMAEYISHGGD